MSKNQSTASQDKDASRMSLGQKIFSVGLAFLIASFVIRTFVSGSSAELQMPWDNAFISGLMLLSGLLVVGGQFLSSKDEDQRLDLAPEQSLAWPLLALFASLAIGLIPAVDADLALRQALNFFSMFFFFALLLRLLKDQAYSLSFLSLGLSLSLLFSLYGLYEFHVEYPMVQKLIENGSIDAPNFNEDQMREFRYRLQSPAAIGPFLIANLLGGYLAMWWPVLIVIAAWLWKRGQRLTILAPVLGLVIIALGMMYTKSKGIIPASVAAVWLLIWLWPTAKSTNSDPKTTPETKDKAEVDTDSKENAENSSTETVHTGDADSAPRKTLSKRRKALLAVTLAGLFMVVAGLGIFARNREAYGLGLSLQVRLEYWQAATGMFKENPALGVGLNNFRSHYTQHKVERSEETKFAHNTFFQVLADQGLLGLFVYLWLLISLIREATSPSQSDAEEVKKRGPPKVLVVVGGVILGFLFLMATSGRYGLTFQTFLGLVMVIAATLGWSHLLSKFEDTEGRDEYLRAGLLAGFGAFLVHGAFDFSFHSHGLLINGLWLLALALRMGRSSGAPSSALTQKIWIVPVVAAFLILAIWPSQMRKHGEYFTRGRDGYFTALKVYRDAQGGTQDPGTILKLLEDAATDLRVARDAYDKGVSVHFTLGEICANQWRVSGYQEEYAIAALKSYNDAIERNAMSADLYFRKALFLEECFLQKRKSGAADTGSDSEIVKTFEKAVELYPTQPRYQYHLGRWYLIQYEAGRRAKSLKVEQLNNLKSRGINTLQKALETHEKARLERVQLMKEQISLTKTLLERYKD
ncbi:MAG: O-antigen ligase family protein [Planctomycetota bacterium]|nr:O-antigen ligase family protein [Planctomycetota bacterium]